MAIRLSNWLHRRKVLLHQRKEKSPDFTLEKVVPEHPEDYPARHLKEILDQRRADFEERRSKPTGMPDGPGPLT